jgi:hypothetical protein
MDRERGEDIEILSACCCALLPIRSFTSRSHLGDEVEAVRVVAPLEISDTGVQGLKQLSPLLRIEIIIDGKQLDLGAIRQLGRLIHHEATVLDDCFERLHHSRV